VLGELAEDRIEHSTIGPRLECEEGFLGIELESPVLLRSGEESLGADVRNQPPDVCVAEKITISGKVMKLADDELAFGAKTHLEVAPQRSAEETRARARISGNQNGARPCVRRVEIVNDIDGMPDRLAPGCQSAATALQLV
jgi:hypothetical protein